MQGPELILSLVKRAAGGWQMTLGTQSAQGADAQVVFRRGLVKKALVIDIPPVARRASAYSGVTNALGRVSFVFDPPFDAVPFVTPVLHLTSAAGCTAHVVGSVTKSGCVIEVRKPKALIAGLVGVAHELAPGVTVQILAQILD